MARRSDHSRDELYELMMAAAREIVERDGYRGLTARNVADFVGYSPGTIYNLFGNLDDMIVHLNGRTLDDLHDQLAEIPFTGTPSTDFHALLDRYLAFLHANKNLWRTLFEFTLPEGQEAPDWYARKVHRLMSVVERALAPLFGENEAAERGNATRVLWAGLHGITSLSDGGKLQVVTAQSVKDMSEMLVSNFIEGLTARNLETGALVSKIQTNDPSF
jgi:AcrR family transcriptional regulator